ncbi:MAG: hypothetical protein NTW97_02110 [Candidatus Krumholzibacteria bacterium]|nr:hypothetical protein [Candidatus Krumholzibacteria bacterium]
MRNERRSFMRAAALAAISVVLLLSGTDGAAPRREWQKRWVYIASNLYVDENVQKIEDVLRRARAADYTGVLFSDTKTLTWPLLGEPERWKRNAAKVRAAATKLGLELVVSVFPFGYSESFLANDPNLAAGLPIREAALVRRGDRLVPEEPAGVGNGSFEEYRGDRAADFGLQDDSGNGSFIDTKIFREGRASIRFENTGVVNEHGLGRVFQRIAVKPWQQYRIRVWMKTERLTADMIGVVALVSRRSLQYQDLAIPEGQGFRYVDSAEDLTTDWVEQSVTFNSLNYTSVIVGAGVWGAKGGKIWWDDLRVDAVPTLNVLRRETLPLAVTGRRGAVYEEGRDFDRIADPALGRSRWPGTYDTRHEPPAIGVPAGSRIREGERVSLSCYHPAIIYGGRVSCTLVNDKIFDLCRRQIEWTNETKGFRSSGELLAFNIRRCREIAKRTGRGKPLYVWSDMFDPYHNARGGYYLVNNSFAESWKGLDPEVTVMKWGEPEKAGKSLAFFSRRVKRIMIAGFYDGDVKANHALWANAIGEAPNVVGVMYTTWRGDYSKLEEFARVWWGGARAAPERR